jgi:hypothetical protein
MSKMVITTEVELTDLIRSIIAPFFVQKEKPEPKESPPLYRTRKEVAAILNITLPTVDKHTDSGLLKATYIGRRVLYDQKELTRSLDNLHAIIARRKKINK